MVDERISKAIALRRSGESIKTIALRLSAAQSSVSTWVRDVKLTEAQKTKLMSNTHSRETIEKRRQSRLINEAAKRTAIINDSKNKIDSLSKRELWLIGTALYWAEGGKTQSTVRFSNGDPKMIQLMMKFFTEVCHVDRGRLKCHIHIHESLNTKRAERYWQKITGLPARQFYKTYNKPNRSSKGTRNSLPYGVCDIYSPDYKLFYKIKGWADGIYESSIKML